VGVETTSKRIETRYMAIRQSLGWILPYEGWSEAQDLFLQQLVAEFEQSRNNVMAKSARLRHDLDHLDKIIEFDNPLLNNLGELQDRPAALEAAVGEFYGHKNLLDAFVRLNKRAREPKS
jgi:hypothetical protein